MRRRNRGFSLIQVIAMLPVIGAMITAGYQVTIHTMRSQAAVRRQMDEQAILSDLIRRLRQDAWNATGATIDVDGENQDLRLSTPDGVVIYSSHDDQVIRQEINGRQQVMGPWRLEFSRLSFRLEAFSEGSGVVWVICDSSLPAERGPAQESRLATAVRIGRGR